MRSALYAAKPAFGLLKGLSPVPHQLEVQAINRGEFNIGVGLGHCLQASRPLLPISSPSAGKSHRVTSPRLQNFILVRFPGQATKSPRSARRDRVTRLERTHLFRRDHSAAAAPR